MRVHCSEQGWVLSLSFALPFSLALFCSFLCRQLEKKAVGILARQSSQHMVQNKEEASLPVPTYQMLGKLPNEIL